jgi:hypothetical protein
LKSWIHHISNGYSTVNLVHINDIVKVTEYAFENFSKFKSERVIVSAGAFRYLDFAKYYGIEIPLKTPDEDL